MREYKIYIENHLTNESILPTKSIFERGKDLFAIEGKGDFEKLEETIVDKKDKNPFINYVNLSIIFTKKILSN